MVMDNGFEEVRVERVEMRFKVKQSVDLGGLDSVEVDRIRPRQGESIRLKVCVKPYEGEKETLAFDFPIPMSCEPGEADLYVFGADSYQMWDRMRARARYEPRSYDDVVDMLVEAPNHRHIVVLLARKSRVAMLGRETLRQMPPSAESILEAAASDGDRANANAEILQKLEYATDFNLVGKARLSLVIKPRKY